MGKKLIIGKHDKIDLPEFNILNIKAKIDTGADSSSIHCTKIRIVERDNKTILKFKILDEELHEVESFYETEIKNSFGQTETRYVINTTIVLFNNTYDFVVSLTDRSDMKFPILLGKKLLNKNFIVDVSKVNLSYKLKNKK